MCSKWCKLRSKQALRNLCLQLTHGTSASITSLMGGLELIEQVYGIAQTYTCSINIHWKYADCYFKYLVGLKNLDLFIK